MTPPRKMPLPSALLLLLALLPCGTAAAGSLVRGDLPRRDGRPLEEIPGLDSEYDVLVASDGSRLRTIMARPSGPGYRRQGLYFVQWLSCDSIELPAAAQGGWPAMMRRVFSESGSVSFRLEKAGVGDSEGPPCDRLDYETELRHHREALRMFRRQPGVDPDRIILYGASMGATMAPLLANEPGVAAVVVWGGGARTWFERTLAFERRRREGLGMPGAQVARELRAIEELLGEYLIRRATPEAISASPRLAEAWDLLGGIDGGLQYGRSAAFHQQAQTADWAAAWEKVEVPVLVLLGEHDWFEDPAGAAWIADLVNRRRSGLARFALIPGLDHHFTRYPSLAAAVRDEGGPVGEGPVVESILAFLRERVSGNTPTTGPPLSSAGLESYVRAKEVLDAGIEAIGGRRALEDAGTVRRRMSGDWFGSFQSPRPHRFIGPTLDPPPASQHTRVVSVIDYARNRWLEESFEYDDAGDSITRVQSIDGEQGFETVTYRDEKPYFRAFPRDELPLLLARTLRRHPEGLLRLALGRPETLQWVGNGEALGRRQRVISLADTSGTRLLLYFDEETDLMTKSEVLRSHPVAGDTVAEVIFADYRPVGALRLPFRYVNRVAGIPTEEMLAESIDVQAPFPESPSPPLDHARMEVDPALPAVQALGGGLYLIRGPYNVAFAVFRDHVIAFEAPLSARYAEDCLALIRATAPDKPVRYVVATHFHADHIGGLRAYVAREIPVVTTPDAEAVIRQAMSARHTMHPDDLSSNPRPPRIETVGRERIFDDGTNRVEIHDIGPTGHVKQMLVAYFPKQKVLFEADVWDVISDDQHIAGSDAETMARRIRDLGLDVERIIPVHGLPCTIEDLNRGLAIRAKYAK